MADISKHDQHPSSPRSRDLASTALEFLSNASNETLCACTVGLGIATYLVLGRIGLLLIGVGAGVVLHATWADEKGRGSYGSSGEESTRRREVGLDIVKRLLDWQDGKSSELVDASEEGDVVSTASSRKELNFSEFRPETRSALTTLVDAVIRDYVKWWYSPILPMDANFPSACQQTLVAFLLAVSSRLSRKRPADAFLNFLINTSSVFTVFLNELARALMASGQNDTEPSEAIQLYLERNPDSSLANVLNRDEHEKKFKAVADDVLQAFLDSKAYSCAPAKIFLREILSGVVFESLLNTCSKPEWINGWIVYLLEEGEPEIMNAIDKGVSGAHEQPISPSKRDTQSNINSKDKSSTIRAISENPQHRRNISKAEEAMDDAMQEAKRLSEMIAAEQAKKRQPVEDITSSTASTESIATPTSSRSDRISIGNSHESSADEEGFSTNHATITKQAPPAPFTTFDQILPPQSSPEASRPPPLTLHNAKISIFDDSQPGEKGNIRSKPTIDYLLQVEPASSHYPGWMIARKYADFETLHEVLRRIAVISDVPEFTQKYSALPSWKQQTKSTLRSDLELYLHEALRHRRLAESEGMKRFLEKDEALGKMSSSKGVLGFPSPDAFQTMGKGMLDVLVSAPKGAADGSKAFLGGVTGVFGQKKSTSKTARNSGRSQSVSSVNQVTEELSSSRPTSVIMNSSPHRPSEDNFSNPRLSSTESLKAPPLPSRPSGDGFERRNALTSLSEDQASDLESHNSSLVDVSSASVPALTSPPSAPVMALNLPPPPSEISDDYGSSGVFKKQVDLQITTNGTMSSGVNSPVPVETRTSGETEDSRRERAETVTKSSLESRKSREAPRPLSEEETMMAVELLFTIVNELYTLSSAWNIRKTLLNAAKSYLLRPGNPSLEAIRVLLQDTVIEANTSDSGIATHLLKMRENSLPTEEELSKWPPPLDEDESDQLRTKARKLLVERGMPQALTSVMGSAASGEALGRLFDALQVEHVSRGLMFAMLVQGIRMVTH